MQCVNRSMKKRKVLRVSNRRNLKEKCGNDAFLFPLGTPARPGIPGYPVYDSSCCFSCKLAKNAYQRLSINISRVNGPYRSEMERKKKAIKAKAKNNGCNWAM